MARIQSVSTIVLTKNEMSPRHNALSLENENSFRVNKTYHNKMASHKEHRVRQQFDNGASRIHKDRPACCSTSSLKKPSKHLSKSLHETVVSDVEQLVSPHQHWTIESRAKTINQLDPMTAASARERLFKILEQPIHWKPATEKTLATEMPVRTRRQAIDVHPRQKAKDKIVRDLVYSGRVSKTWPPFARVRPFRGLRNPHNYCYRRSVMQAFLHLPAFISWIEGHPSTGDNRSIECPTIPCIACAFRKLLKAYYSKQPISAELGSFDASINRIWPRLRYISNKRQIMALQHSQQDADEFIVCILNALCDAPARTLPMSVDVREALFEVSLSRSWQCDTPKCPERNHTVKHSESTLILDILRPRKGLQLEQYVQNYFAGDVVDVRCDGCQKNHKQRHRNQELLAGPEILIIQLRRFQLFSKIKSHVGIPNTLDLTKYQPRSSWSKNKLRYKLMHIIYHMGGSIASGHYISDCTGPDGLYECNDEIVSKKPKFGANMDRADPYILMYTRIGVGRE